MKKPKIRISVMAGALVAVMLLSNLAGMLPVQAASSGEIREQINALEDQKAALQAQMEELERQMSDNLSQMEQIVEQKKLLDQQVFLLYEQIANVDEQIAAYRVLIADKQDELEAAQQSYDALRSQYRERIRAMEEEGKLSYWSVLFKASSFADLLDRVDMIEEIAASDQRRLRELNAAAKQVADAQAELEAGKASLEKTKADLDASQIILEAKQAQARQLLEDLRSRGEEFEIYMASAEEEQGRIMLQIAAQESAYDEAVDREYWATYVPPTTTAPPTTTPPTTTPPATTPPTTTPPATTPPTTTPPTTTPPTTTPPTTTPPTTEPPTTVPAQGDGENDSSGGSGTSNSTTWLTPVPYYTLTSPFGWRVHPIYGDMRFHQGVDLACDQGTPIYASRSGIIKSAGYDSSMGYYVIIDHQDGFRSIYMHMTHYIVSAGEYVAAGQVIGYVGSTGDSTGPHLHFGIYDGSIESYVNPMDYIS